MKLIRRVKSKGYESFTFLGMRLYRRVESDGTKRISVLGIPVYSKKTKDYRTVRRILFWKTRRYDKQRQLVDMLEAGARERESLRRDMAARLDQLEKFARGSEGRAAILEKKVGFCTSELSSLRKHYAAAGERLAGLEKAQEAQARQAEERLAALEARMQSAFAGHMMGMERNVRYLQALQYAAMHGMGTPLISVVMPVYNGIRFLRETLDSILAQTFPYFELICVDDGSTDGSGALLDEWALKDERISVIHQENRGAGEARNRGLEVARGRYVLFLDADDIYMPDMFSAMFLRAEACLADVVVCGAESFEEGKGERTPIKNIRGDFASQVFSGRERASDIFQCFSHRLWDKMFRRDLLERSGLRFPGTAHSEDAFVACLALAAAQRIASVPEILVSCRVHPFSREAKVLGKDPAHLEVYDLMRGWLEERGLFSLFRRTFFNFAVRHGIGCLSTSGWAFQAFRLETYLALKTFLQEHFDAALYPRAYYNRESDFDFVHSMFVKKPCRLRYSVVMPCYNVEKYIDEALESLAQQTVDFTQSIECILVDDGSTDSTPEKIRQWAERYPNIVTVSKENGGLSSARNAGLEVATCPWVTFMDPDDFLHPDYFYRIDSALAEHGEETAYIAGRFIVYWEQKRRFAPHPLDFKYTEAVRVLALEEIGDAIQCAVNHAFLRREVIRENGLLFSPKCRPSFEDSHFLFRYLFFSGGGKAVYVKDALYLYRKREDGTSLLDSSWQVKTRYDDILEHGYADALEFYKEKQGKVPTFAQNTVMYNLYWYFCKLANSSDKVSFLSEEEVERFWTIFARIVSNLDEDKIVSSPTRWLGREDRIAMVERFLHRPYPQVWFHVLGFDPVKNMVHVSHVEAEGNSGIVSINGEAVKPVLTKVQKQTFMRRDWVDITHEWYSLDGFDDKAVISASMADGREASLLISKKVLGKRLSLAKLKSSFALPLPDENSRFADAWLVMDRDESADDNGEHFYRWLMKHHPEQKAFFVLRKEARDWARLEKEGFALVDFGSRDYEGLFRNCSKIISAYNEKYIYASFAGCCYKDYVFLQHGVVQNEQAESLNKLPSTLFITSARKEYEHLSGNSYYKYSKKEVALTGLPRHDSLIVSPVEKRRRILVMPTWRNYLVGRKVRGSEWAKNPDFTESTYFKSWHSFLHSECLRELSERYGFEVVFYPHQLAQPYLDDFDCPSHVKPVRQGECGMQELFLSSVLMITDFSSVAMEMAYTGRSVLYYQFDEEEFFKKHLQKGYFDYRRDGFGPVVAEESDLLRELEVLLARGGEMADEYRERAEAFFAFRDGRCCERTYEAILALDEPHAAI